MAHGPLTMSLVYPGNGLPIDGEKRFWIGWQIEREKGWHTYWKHPGDVGVSPSVKWNLSNSCEAGEIVFPPPHRVSMTGIRAYGHYGETLFLIPFTLSGTPEKEITIRGDFSWLACSRTCMPATAKLSLTIPMVDKLIKDKPLAERFRTFWDKQPRDPPAAWDFQAHALGKFIHLQFPRALSGHARPMDFFAEDRVVLSDQTPQVREQEGRLQWLLKKSPWDQSPPDQLAGLLAVGEGEDLVHYRIKMPVLKVK